MEKKPGCRMVPLAHFGFCKLMFVAIFYQNLVFHSNLFADSKSDSFRAWVMDADPFDFECDSGTKRCPVESTFPNCNDACITFELGTPL